MAKVLVSLRIFPADIDVDRSALKTKIKENLPDYATVHNFEEEPIAFGLVAVRAHISLPEDRAGAIDEVESSIRQIVEISDFQTLMVSRV